MPSWSAHYCGFWESNPKLWEKCQNEISNQMIADGWTSHAKKFNSVMRIRARNLFMTKK